MERIVIEALNGLKNRLGIACSPYSPSVDNEVGRQGLVRAWEILYKKGEEVSKIHVWLSPWVDSSTLKSLCNVADTSADRVFIVAMQNSLYARYYVDQHYSEFKRGLSLISFEEGKMEVVSFDQPSNVTKSFFEELRKHIGVPSRGQEEVAVVSKVEKAGREVTPHEDLAVFLGWDEEGCEVFWRPLRLINPHMVSSCGFDSL